MGVGAGGGERTKEEVIEDAGRPHCTFGGEDGAPGCWVGLLAAGAADAAATSEPGSARWVRSGGLGLWSRTAGLGRQGAWKSKGG